MVHRNDIIVRINERLRGQISDAALAAWAFDLFYAIEQGDEEVAEADSDVVSDALDELMFADEEPFALGDADLHRLLARLG
ncbi:hypothetical protein K2Z83_12740 [Oscillochloris sp. ZM17-4]|uniref:hypothetical protein n=1 Tax=Oscillochloris sp. ZM17-4 TaxID=2866714 RepID=UPI001C72F3AD|nr:hypothetical protein [Oscillochloris sp. ZM17-4]MBX0328545.1 hypothetical protein [Oscillochloris sp. ZM17-4]